MLNLLVRKQVLITQTKWKGVGLLLNSLHTEFLHVLYLTVSLCITRIDNNSYLIQKQPPEVFLTISQNSQEKI